MDYWDKFDRWLKHQNLDDETRHELAKIQGNLSEIKDRFGTELSFGTGGIRGIMEAGTNRFNIYTVRKVTMGLANFLNKNCHNSKKEVVIGYDTRNNSRLFAEEAGSILASQGIKTYIFIEPVPIPLLSFAVRKLNTNAGIFITASHNPPKYNGYKVYGDTGGQVTDNLSKKISQEISDIGDELDIKGLDLESAKSKGLITFIGEDIINKYLKYVHKIRINSGVMERTQLKAVYTPLHGTGGKIIPQLIKETGFKGLELVPEQLIQDPNCGTIDTPNPEDWTSFCLAQKIGEELNADLLLATDLDTDRLGIGIRDNENRFLPLTGNELGSMLLYYIISQRAEKGELPLDGKVIKTVVTSELGREIANSYGLETIDTLTGFKYIGELIEEFHKTGKGTFIIGYEESYGYLIADFVRDKDAVQALLMTIEMASYYKSKGMSLYDVLESIYEKYGYFKEELINIELESSKISEVEEIMDCFRNNPKDQYGGRKVIGIYDYISSEFRDRIKGSVEPTGLPLSNSIKIMMDEGSWFCIRPSGTEPKLKIYIGVNGKSREDSSNQLDLLKKDVLKPLSAL